MFGRVVWSSDDGSEAENMVGDFEDMNSVKWYVPCQMHQRLRVVGKSLLQVEKAITVPMKAPMEPITFNTPIIMRAVGPVSCRGTAYYPVKHDECFNRVKVALAIE